MFRPNSLFYTDGYKIGHKEMLAPNTDYLYGTGIPRSLKYAPKGVTKITSFGQQFATKWVNDEFEENFFNKPIEEAQLFAEDMSVYLGLPYNGDHFTKLHKVGYLPIRVKSLPEGIETPANVPHLTFINTLPGFAWLTLYLETIISSVSWKSSLSASIALQYKRNATEWVNKTDSEKSWLIPFMCHDFSARGLDPFSMLASGLGHATSFRGSDSIICIPGARYYYGEKDVCINSVNASEHSVTCTGIFYYERLLKIGGGDHLIKEYYSFDVPCEGSVDSPDYLAIAEWANLRDWLKKFPIGILSVVSDTFNLWKLITYLLPRLKKEILAREGKLVIRPDSGDPIDIICGNEQHYEAVKNRANRSVENKGVIELLWDIFGGTVSKEGYKCLDSHIGAIYGDSINLERQVKIYSRLANKEFAATNIVLGVGSFTYQMNTRDTLGFAIKGAWFEADGIGYDIYKDPATDDGTKKSLKGLICVTEDFQILTQCTKEQEEKGLLQVIFEDGKFYNTTTLTEIRARLEAIV